MVEQTFLPFTSWLWPQLQEPQFPHRRRGGECHQASRIHGHIVEIRNSSGSLNAFSLQISSLAWIFHEYVPTEMAHLQ